MMALKEYLDMLQPGSRIRIGAKNGSGWLFAGTVDGINWDHLDKIAISRIPIVVRRRDPFVPVQNREIVENYMSIRNPDVMCIVVEGHEVAREKDDGIKVNYKPLDDLGVVNIAIAAVRSIANELMYARKMRDETSDPYLRYLWVKKVKECKALLYESEIIELLGSSADGLLRWIEGH